MGTLIAGSQDTAQAIAQAVAHLQQGQLLGMPTETVYGLAADANNAAAVASIFTTKGRPSNHPLIVHIAQSQDAAHFAASIPAFAQRLMDALWPGPLTLILPRAAGVATAAAGGQDSIGLRCPSHPVAQALLSACRAVGIWGLAAPSANAFGRVSPTTAAHVRSEFGDGLLILDGGACQVGIESTIIDCTRGTPVLLRPGVLTRAEIESTCACPLIDPAESANPCLPLPAAPRASGTLEAHYAPTAPVRLMTAPMLQAALDVMGVQTPRIAIWARSALRIKSSHTTLRRMPDDALAAAQQLFGTLRGFDDLGCTLIWIETPPADNAWAGVLDRLSRASAAQN